MKYTSCIRSIVEFTKHLNFQNIQIVVDVPNQ